MNNNYFQKPLLQMSEDPQDFWTVDDATKGISIMGGTGSGKTTASGKKIALGFLKEGWGGLVLCAKTDEADLWRQYCKEAGREDDLIIFGKGAKHLHGPYAGDDIVFNPIDYELKREGSGAGETQNITNIFMNIYRMGNRIASEGDTHEERYWDTALKRCLNRIIELLKLSGEDLAYRNMVKVLSTSDNFTYDSFLDTAVAVEGGKTTLEFLQINNYCLFCLIKAYIHSNSEDTTYEIVNSHNMVEQYFTKDLPRMSSRTKSVVVESFMGLAEPFLSGLLYRHFSGATNIFPESVYEKNKIIVLDFPIKEFLDTGIIGQCVFKLLFQQAVERRDVGKYPIPVFLWCDEAQYFINPYDQIFLTTARSSRTATVFLSQNISNYLAVMGSGSDAKARVDSLMGNLSTKIFHANSDAETNEYASRLIGNDIISLANASDQQSYLDLNFSQTTGLSSQFLPQVQPRVFTTLKTGGKLKDFEVHAIIIQSGREWSDGKNYIKTIFTQNFESYEQ
jgi:TraM recognition site of TraD and TraG